jgi:hypothetical protein
MNQLLDRQYALKVLKMLATDFKDMDAFKKGIIDKDGNVLKKSYQLKSQDEKKAYTYLDRLVITLKKAIKKFEKRGDYTLTRALSPALWVVREQLESGSRATMNIEGKYESLLKMNVTLAEEEILVKKFLEEDGEGGMGVAAVGGAPTNNISGASVKEPVVKKKDVKKYHGTVARRSQLNIPEVKP